MELPFLGTILALLRVHVDFIKASFKAIDDKFLISMNNVGIQANLPT